MKNVEVDLVKELEELENKAKNIDEVVRLYKNRVLELQSQIQLAELSIKEAENRAHSAEELAHSAQQQYRKAIELKDGQYEQLIHDLFEAPQRQLVRHMEGQSRKSNARTVSIAILSIIISTIITASVSAYFQPQSSASTNELLAKMNLTMNSVESMKVTQKPLLRIFGGATQTLNEFFSSCLMKERIFRIINQEMT